MKRANSSDEDDRQHIVLAEVLNNKTDNNKTKIIHLLENYRRTIDVSAISHGLHQETAESAWVTHVSRDS